MKPPSTSELSRSDCGQGFEGVSDAAFRRCEQAPHPIYIAATASRLCCVPVLVEFKAEALVCAELLNMEAIANIRTGDPSAAAGGLRPAQPPLHKWKQIVCENSLRPVPRSGAASVVFKDSLYVLGGYGGNGRLDDLWQYLFQEGKWLRLETSRPMPTSRENNGAVLYKGGMYIFGGYSGQFWLNDFHRLDLSTS